MFTNSKRTKEWPAAFKLVDRTRFCPEELKTHACCDKCLDSDWFHQSAPWVYAMVLDAFELREGLSVLHVGSGSGYFAALVASKTGPNGINHGIDISEKMVSFAQNATKDMASRFQFLVGNLFALNVHDPQRVRYDRIYVGAKALPSDKPFLLKLLKPEGVLVGAFGSEMTKIRSDTTGETISEEVLGVVDFAPLIEPADLDIHPLTFDRESPWSMVLEAEPTENDFEIPTGSVGGWPCPLCTFENVDGAQKCAVCEIAGLHITKILLLCFVTSQKPK